MRVLVLGATGLLGRVLLEEWAIDEVTGIGSRDADIRNRAQLHPYFVRCQPEWTVLAAAYTDVDACERDPKPAHDVNCSGAANVAFECKESGSRLLFVSTDYVFDGAKSAPYEINDEMNLLSVYGQSKAEAERLVHGVLPHTCILRTSWLFGANGRCSPNTILGAAGAGKKLSVVDDQIGRPTYNRDLARTIIQPCRASAQGTVHVSNSDSCSWYEFACHLLRAVGLGDLTVEAIPTEALSRPARRPKRCVLSLASLEQYSIQLRPWQETLTDYIGERIAFTNSHEPLSSSAGRTA
jgi:dTDP-4-dehydrorhamnose reductase